MNRMGIGLGSMMVQFQEKHPEAGKDPLLNKIITHIKKEERKKTNNLKRIVSRAKILITPQELE
jgi:hypothetical protein